MKFTQGDEVLVQYDCFYTRTGRIVGMVSAGNTGTQAVWIIEDTSGHLPNERYPYSCFALAECLIEKKDA